MITTCSVLANIIVEYYLEKLFSKIQKFWSVSLMFTTCLSFLIIKLNLLTIFYLVTFVNQPLVTFVKEKEKCPVF